MKALNFSLSILPNLNCKFLFSDNVFFIGFNEEGMFVNCCIVDMKLRSNITNKLKEYDFTVKLL